MESTTLLDPVQSQIIIDKAIRGQAQVVLESAAIGPRSVNGFFLSGDSRALLIELTGQHTLNPAVVANAECDVQFYSGKRYRFSSNIQSAPQWGETRAVSVRKPEVISVSERRRLLRATLAPSSSVELSWQCAGAPFRCVATLLNVGAGGLACRVPADAARGIAPDAAVTASFQLPWQGRTYRLSASVTNKTPGSDNNMILGLAFDAGADCASDRISLQEALERSDDVLARGEI